MTIPDLAFDCEDTLTWHTFLVFQLPFFLTYQMAAFLVLVTGRRPFRLIFFPIPLWSAYRFVTSVKLGRGDDPRYDYWNHGNLLMVGSIIARIWGWSITAEKYQRMKRVGHRPSVMTTLVDSFELCINTRGIGWNWGKGNYAPAIPNPPTSNPWRLALSIIGQIVAFDLTHVTAKYLLPLQCGGTIFNLLLPRVQRYTLASAISFLLGFMIYLFINTSYNLLGLIAIFVLRDSPSSWPPIFKSPWLSISLADFWGKRWHQVFRHIFLTAAGGPLSLLFRRPGFVMGSFFASGVVHALGVWGMGRGGDFVRVCGFFLMMGVGILCERLWCTITQYRINGWLGRVWTLSWIVGWSNMMFDVWARKGMLDSVFLPSYLRATSLASLFSR